MKEFSDYEFLSAEDPLIYSILTSAQSYVRTDPNTALIKLRQFAEILVGAIASENCFEETLNKGLADQIVILEKQGFLPSTESGMLHQLRIEGNKAAHPDLDNLEGDYKVAQQNIGKAIHLVHWFQKTYRDASKISVSLEIDKKPGHDKQTIGETRLEPDALKNSSSEKSLMRVHYVGAQGFSEDNTEFENGLLLMKRMQDIGNIEYGELTLKEYFELSQQFDSIDTHFHRLESSRGDLLNVVLLGEFRTGKSTLANLLIGQDISPTDVMDETTATIIQFIPTVTSEYCEIVYPDGTCERIDYRMYFDNYKTTKHGQEKIYLYMPTGMNFILVDTPGIGGSVENERKVIDNLLQADVVLWVMDSTIIGGIREYELMKYLNENGIPMLLVLSYWDKINEGDRKEILDYCITTYNISKDKIFPMSNSDKTEAEREQGIRKLKEYLDNHILVRNKEIRDKAIKGRLKILVNECQRLLDNILIRLEHLETKISQRKEAISKIADNITDDIRVFLESYVSQYFLNETDVQKDIIKEVRQKAKSGMNHGLFQQVVPKDYIHSFLEELKRNYVNHSRKLWEETIGEFGSITDTTSMLSVREECLSEYTKSRSVDSAVMVVEKENKNKQEEWVKPVVLGLIGYLAGGPLAGLAIGALSYSFDFHSKLPERDIVITVKEDALLNQLKDNMIKQLRSSLLPSALQSNREIGERIFEEGIARNYKNILPHHLSTQIKEITNTLDLAKNIDKKL